MPVLRSTAEGGRGTGSLIVNAGRWLRACASDSIPKVMLCGALHHTGNRNCLACSRGARRPEGPGAGIVQKPVNNRGAIEDQLRNNRGCPAAIWLGQRCQMGEFCVGRTFNSYLPARPQRPRPGSAAEPDSARLGARSLTVDALGVTKEARSIRTGHRASDSTLGGPTLARRASSLTGLPAAAPRAARGAGSRGW